MFGELLLLTGIHAKRLFTGTESEGDYVEEYDEAERNVETS
jgi:hypothetical protein